MPKQIELTRNLPAMMTRTCYETMLLSWVASRMHLSPSFKVPTAVKDFLNYYKIPIEFWEPRIAINFVYTHMDEINGMKFNELIKQISDYENRQ